MINQKINRLLAFGFFMVSAGCGSSGLQGLPRIADNQAIIWHYSCGKGALNVEYAQMGGEYSATLRPPSAQKKVLIRAGENEFSFIFESLLWRSDNAGKSFSLYKDGEVLLDNCIATEPRELADI